MEIHLTVEQAALRLQMHPVSVRRLLARGQIRGIKRGRVWRVPESALDEGVVNQAGSLPTRDAAGEESPLARALAMVDALDARGRAVSADPTQDAAALLREAREARRGIGTS